jgi:ribonuclease HI
MIEIYTDGSSYNPLISSYGFIVYKDKNKIYEESGIINERNAEFHAIYKALEWIIKQDIRNEEIIIKSDAIPNIQCYNKIKNMNFRKYIKFLKGKSKKSKYGILKAKDLVYRIEYYNNRISFIRIPRKLNYEAHFLAIKAIKNFLKIKIILKK